MENAILLAVLAILILSAQGAERVGVTIDGWVVNPGAFTLTQGTTLKALIKEGTQNTHLHANGQLSKTGAKFILGHFASRVFLLRSGEHVIKPGITVKALNEGEEDYGKGVRRRFLRYRRLVRRETFIGVPIRNCSARKRSGTAVLCRTSRAMVAFRRSLLGNLSSASASTGNGVGPEWH